MDPSCLSASSRSPLSLRGLFMTVLLGVLMTACGEAPSTDSSGGADGADMVIWGGKIVTVNADQPEVEALAVKGDRIVAAGTKADVEAMVSDATEVGDLAGRLAIPGFVEAHAHYVSIGDAAIQLPLAKAQSWVEIVDMVKQAAADAEPGSWIRGRGWHQDKWSDSPARVVDGFPTHDDLSAAAPDHPVLLTHASGHALLANAKAMELAGINADTPDPAGGDIVRDDAGKASGLFNETAQGLIHQARGGGGEGDAPAEEMRRMIELAGEECRSKGVTSFHDAGSPFSVVDALGQAADEGRLGTRVWVMVEGSNDDLEANLASYKTTDRGAFHLAVGGIKRYMDGALGSRGALLLAPYNDDPDTDGLQLSEIDDLRRTAELAKANGYQLAIHAIGDKANRQVLDVFQEALATDGEALDLRWRVEHAQHLDPKDIPRFAELGVIASMQTVHCTSDGPWVPERLGDERSEAGAYVWQALLESGAKVINGTDAPVEDVNPIPNFYAAVTRMLKTGEAFYPSQSMTREQALRSMTLDAAYGAFQEEQLGSLEVGKLADVVVLSKDILTVPDDEILSTEVEMTIMGGEVVYTKP